MQATLADFSYTIFFIGSFILSLFLVRKFGTAIVSKWKRRNVMMVGTAIFLVLVFLLTWLVSDSLADYILTFYFTAFGVVFFETSRHRVEENEVKFSQKVDNYLTKVEQKKNNVVVAGMSNEALLKVKQRERAQRKK